MSVVTESRATAIAAASRYFAAANSLTILRLLLIPVATWLLVHSDGHPVYRYQALAILVFQQASDMADGFLARRGRRIVDLPNTIGAVLDPVADKLYLNVTFLALAAAGWFSWPIALFFAVKDLLLILGWIIFSVVRHRVEVKPNFFGKAADSMQAFLVFFVVLDLPAGLIRVWTWVTVAMVATAAAGYVSRAVRSSK